MLPLTVEHILLEYACFKIGVIHAPLDLRLKIPEVIRSIALIEAKAFACLGQTAVADFTPVGTAVRDECKSVRHILHFATSDELIPGAIGIQAWTEQIDAVRSGDAGDCTASQKRLADRTDSVSSEQGAQVIYTTGSTGFPKPALLSHRNITAQNMCLMAAFNMHDATRQLVNLPPSHVGCQAEQLMTTFFAGATAVILPLFDAAKTLQAIERYRVNLFGQVPAMFHLQWQLPEFDSYDLSSVTDVIYGGQTVTRAFVDRLLTLAPRVGTGLGLSEMAGFVTYTGMTDIAEDVVQGVGWPMPITPLTVREPMHDDGSAGAEVPFGETGEICFSGPQVFIAYVNNDEAYRQTVSQEGICYTGDRGYMSDKGLIFCGRSKLVIKPKGYQIHPGQIEEHFSQLRDDVVLCGAVGAEHNTHVEAVVLFVALRPESNLSVEDLEQHALGIASYMRPSHYVLYSADQFPLNRINKTDYVTLSQRARTEVERLRASGQWD